jgi:hypothetical protein
MMATSLSFSLAFLSVLFNDNANCQNFQSVLKEHKLRIWSNGGVMLIGENRGTSRKTYPAANWCTTSKSRASLVRDCKINK